MRVRSGLLPLAAALLVAAGCGSSTPRSYTLEQVKRAFAAQRIPLRRRGAVGRSPRLVTLADPRLTSTHGYELSRRIFPRGLSVEYLVLVGEGTQGLRRGNVFVVYGTGEAQAVRAALRGLG